MNSNSVLGVLALVIFSSVMILLWVMAVNNFETKMIQQEQPTKQKITNANNLCFGEQNDSICTEQGWIETEKRGFLFDNQIYKFISDCHYLKGKLDFTRNYLDNSKTFYDLVCYIDIKESKP